MNWMLAAILICGAGMVTSCSTNDNPIIDPEPALPDQAFMFVQNVQNDSRYVADIMEASSPEGETAMSKVIRLEVNSYEEAQEEFLKLLPEGVAETAFVIEDFYKGLFTEATGYRLNAPATNDEDVIAFSKVYDFMTSVIGFAWVQLTPDLQEAFDAEMIVYMPKAEEDDLANFINCMVNILPYSVPSPENPTAIICTCPSTEMYMEAALSFITTKMMATAQPTEDGNLSVSLTDSSGNLYGHMIVLSAANRGDALSVYVMDEALQASLAAQIGMPLSKISFYLGAEAAEE